MNNIKEKTLPSEKIQKVYEINPSYILKKIRNEDSLESSLHLAKMEEENKQFPKLLLSDNNLMLSLNNTSIQSNSSFDSEYNDKNNINSIKSCEEGNNIIKEEENINNKLVINNNISLQNNIININNNNNLNKNSNLINNENNSYSKDGNLFINNIFLNMMIQNNCSSYNNKNNSAININNYNKDKILNNLKNYWGSIYLQEKLSYMNDKDISILLNIILPNINDIMCLEFGNYFFQKLIKRLNVSQRLAIYHKIQPYFLDIAKNKNGTHSIQSLIDEIKTPNEQVFLDTLLNQNMLFLFNDKNAYHIIMKIIIEKREEQRNNINIYLIDNIKINFNLKKIIHMVLIV